MERLKDDAERHRAKNNRKNEKRPFSKQKRPDLVSSRGRSAAVAIFKSKVWHPVAKHGSTKQEGSPITKKEIRCVVPLPLPLFQGSVSFHPTIVRFGMTNRFVKDCRVGRTRPPRNDTKLAGLMKNLPVSYIGMYESVAERHHIGASSEAPCYAGAGPHFLCEAFLHD